jgi:hypothetical protein
VSIVHDVLRTQAVELLQTLDHLREHLLATRAGKVSNVWRNHCAVIPTERYSSFEVCTYGEYGRAQKFRQREFDG